MTGLDDVRSKPLRAAWKVALYAFLVSTVVGAAVGLTASIASGGITHGPWRAGELYGRALSPFILAVTIGAYAIQRSRRSPQ